MKLVVQRVLNAQVDVDGKTVGKINKGFMVLCGITHEDTEKEGNNEIQELINKYNKVIEEKLKVKEQELMTI